MLKLSPAVQKFILHWGEMGTKWGINRTMAQIHALLFISPRPLHAEEIAQTLSVARSNVSTCLRELQGWRIVKCVNLYGDRRDHYESLKDVWQMFRIIAEERKRREIDPTLEALRACMEDLEKGTSSDAYVNERLAQLLDFFETSASAYDKLKDMPIQAVIHLLNLGKKAGKLLKIP